MKSLDWCKCVHWPLLFIQSVLEQVVVCKERKLPVTKQFPPVCLLILHYYSRLVSGFKHRIIYCKCLSWFFSVITQKMDYLKKLKDSVTNVLPVSNPVFAEFDVHNHRASAGPGLMWKVYDAVNKTTKQVLHCFYVFCICLQSIWYDI